MLSTVLPGLANHSVRITKGSPKKPKDEIPVHAFCVKTCWEGHTKDNPKTPAHFAFSKCSERWNTMCGKEKYRRERMHYDHK